MKGKMIHKRKIIIAAAALLFLLTVGYACYVVEIGNFRAITPGEAYRSAQLESDKLEYYIKQYGIRSILNLRGENSEMQWYKDEMRASAAYGVAHYDIAMSSSRFPTDETIKELISILKTAPRPILIHCQYGADRSGLVAAMWKVIVDNEPKSEAKKQLSFLYGHVPILGRDAMDRFFEKWPVEQYSH